MRCCETSSRAKEEKSISESGNGLTKKARKKQKIVDKPKQKRYNSRASQQKRRRRKKRSLKTKQRGIVEIKKQQKLVKSQTKSKRTNHKILWRV